MLRRVDQLEEMMKMKMDETKLNAKLEIMEAKMDHLQKQSEKQIISIMASVSKNSKSLEKCELDLSVVKNDNQKQRQQSILINDKINKFEDELKLMANKCHDGLANECEFKNYKN